MATRDWARSIGQIPPWPLQRDHGPRAPRFTLPPDGRTAQPNQGRDQAATAVHATEKHCRGLEVRQSQCVNTDFEEERLEAEASREPLQPHACWE